MKACPALFFGLFVLLFCDAEADGTKPRIKVVKDGFPTGNSTPEGVACDVSRAFIESDVALLKKSCLTKYGSGETAKRYDAFLAKIVAGTEAEKETDRPHPGRPKAIGKVFAARHLSLSGPGSYGYAVHGFDDVMFVDVGAVLHDGSRFMNRTMVVKKGGRWLVHPCPLIDDLISAGLNDEAESTVDFSERYVVEEGE